MNRILVTTIAAIAVAHCGGCQSYAPSPLNSDDHRALWEARTVDAGQLQKFATTLSAEDASAVFSLTDGVSAMEAEAIALSFNPDLRAARAQAAIAMAYAENAGLWDDPSLSIDVMRMAESVPEPWMIGGMVGFTIPLSGRLSVEKKLANAEHEAQLRRVIDREWRVRAELHELWAEWSAAQLEADLLTELLARELQIVGVVDRLEAAGSLSRLEGRLFRMERASRQSESILVSSKARELEFQIRATMGLTPYADVQLSPQVAIGEPETVEDVFNRLEASNLTLAVHRVEYDIAEQALNLEIRKQYPDVQIGPAYESDEGQNKVGFGLGLPLPVLNANRQGIATARAKRDASRIAYETAHERLASAYAQTQVRFDASKAARATIERDLLPLAEAQIADERRIAELGELDVLLTLESIVRAHETRVQLIDATLAQFRAAIRLRELLGPGESTSSQEGQP